MTDFENGRRFVGRVNELLDSVGGGKGRPTLNLPEDQWAPVFDSAFEGDGAGKTGATIISEVGFQLADSFFKSPTPKTTHDLATFNTAVQLLNEHPEREERLFGKNIRDLNE